MNIRLSLLVIALVLSIVLWRTQAAKPPPPTKKVPVAKSSQPASALKPVVKKEDDYGFFNFLKSDPSIASASAPPVVTKEDNNIKSLFKKEDKSKQAMKPQEKKVAPVKVEAKTPVKAPVKASMASNAAEPPVRPNTTKIPAKTTSSGGGGGLFGFGGGDNKSAKPTASTPPKAEVKAPVKAPVTASKGKTPALTAAERNQEAAEEKARRQAEALKKREDMARAREEKRVADEKAKKEADAARIAAAEAKKKKIQEEKEAEKQARLDKIEADKRKREEAIAAKKAKSVPAPKIQDKKDEVIGEALVAPAVAKKTPVKASPPSGGLGLFGGGVGSSKPAAPVKKAEESVKTAMAQKAISAPPAPPKKVVAAIKPPSTKDVKVEAPKVAVLPKAKEETKVVPSPAPVAMKAPVKAAPAPVAKKVSIDPAKAASKERWERGVSQTLERIESAKCAIVSAIGGSLLYAPFSITLALFSGGLTGQWEFNTDMLAISLAMFGLTYRYAIREDDNDNLKDGVVAAFVLTRTLAMIHVPETCSSLPLDCGEPLHYLSMSMVNELLKSGVDSYVAYNAARYVLDKGFENNLLSKFKK